MFLKDMLDIEDSDKAETVEKIWFKKGRNMAV